MSVDKDVVFRISRLARISVSDDDADNISDQLNRILGFVEQLNEVDITDVPPMTSVVSVEMRRRPDIVDDGNKASEVVSNAPKSDDNFFVVPKVVE